MQHIDRRSPYTFPVHRKNTQRQTLSNLSRKGDYCDKAVTESFWDAKKKKPFLARKPPQKRQSFGICAGSAHSKLRQHEAVGKNGATPE
jgi:hypothetical protein